jgi:hypothetical protein
VPKNTPAEIVDKLNREINAALADPEMKARLADLGGTVIGGSSGLDWPEHGGILNRIGAGGAHHIIGKFKPLVLGEIHAAGDTP